MLFNDGVSFVISYSDKLIIPQLDVNECDISLFTPNTLNEWKLFCNSFNDTFDNAVKKIKKKYNTTINNDIFIKIPSNYNSCIWYNYPNLYNCDGDKVLLYLEKTKSKLSDVYIKTSPFQCLINCNIRPETFLNISITNYSQLVKILIENGETNFTIWCSVACWWNYFTQTTNQTYYEQKFINNFGRWSQENINLKQEQKQEDSYNVDDDDELIFILNNYCCPKLYKRCNWFLMLHSRAIISESSKLLNWINENKKNVIWDEDLISDTPSYAFNNCYNCYSDNEYILNETKKRFI